MSSIPHHEIVALPAPTSLVQLAEVYGIGEKKLADLGSRILEVVGNR